MKPSQHPTLEVTPELRSSIARVSSGVEPVIVLTEVGGEPLAALVSLATLALLDAREVAQRNDAAMEVSDTEGMRPR